MKKQILNIGKALSRSEQKEVFGGNLEIDDGNEGLCYGGSDTCRTDKEKKCCQGSCATKNGKVYGVCMGV